MKKAISITRIIVLYALLIVAIVCILGEPSSETLFSLVVTKAVGIASAFLVYWLASRWKDEEFMREIDRFCDED